MNRRNLLKMIPGAAAALLALGFRKPKVKPVEFISPDAKWIKSSGQMVWKHSFDDADFLERAKKVGLSPRICERTDRHGILDNFGIPVK